MWFLIYIVSSIHTYIILWIYSAYAVTFLSIETPTFSHSAMNTAEKQIKQKGQSHLHIRASLDKAKDSKECILSRSDE